MPKTNNRLEALRMTAKFLYIVAEGRPATSSEFKTFSNLCFLAIPPKLRLTKAEIAEIKARPWDRVPVDYKMRAAGDGADGN